MLRLTSGYGYGAEEMEFRLGDGLVGQASLEKSRIRVREVPPGYLNIRSGLGQAPPSDVVVLPVLFEEHVLGVIELASFRPYSDQHLDFDPYLHDPERWGVSMGQMTEILLPCLDAAQGGVRLLIRDMAEETRWPRFTEGATANDIRSWRAMTSRGYRFSASSPPKKTWNSAAR